MPVSRLDLSDAHWTLHLPDQSVPASVPGCVHTDLLAAGLIPDPYEDDNETKLGWIGRTDAVYEGVFEWEPVSGRTDLVCEGLDTVASVSLNGSVLGETANMHRRYRFDASSALRPGENVLRVSFTAPYAYAEQVRDEVGERPGSYPEPYQYIRKMACNFGWDWGPTLVTSGVWRPIRLETWPVARLSEVRPVVAASGKVTVHVAVERATAASLTVRATVAGVASEATVQDSGVLELEVDSPRLWWPRGYGDQPLYELEVTLHDGSTELDTWRRRIGFRDVALDTTPDEHGSAFTLVVNGQPVFARGANWIPDDCFPSRIGRDRYERRLQQACAANMNLIRVWGGGIYEDDAFYDLCDELGLLVWQDFPFACAAYPEEGPLPFEVEAEARDNIVRLAPHPSLVLWCGNNENVVGYFSWGWQDELDGRTWGAGYYFDLLPRLVEALDPSRPYWPASPYSGTMDHHPDDPGHGTVHQWEVWNRIDYTHYRDQVPRFAAEYGFQAPPAYSTLRAALHDEPPAVDSPGMVHHQKAIDGDKKLAAGLAAHFPEVSAFDDWHYLTQLNQARALTLGIEHLRSHWPITAGSVIWQLNDCWPVTSWSAIDGAEVRKPLWYALRHAYADRLLTVQPREGGLALIAVNDCDAAWSTTAEVSLRDFGGKVLAETLVDLTVDRRGATTIPLPAELAVPKNPLGSVLLASTGRERTFWFFAADRDLTYPAPEFTASVREYTGGLKVTLTAKTLLRDIALFPDRLDPAATVDDMLVTLLPGDTASFLIESPAPLDTEQLLRSPVLRCVNDIR